MNDEQQEDQKHFSNGDSGFTKETPHKLILIESKNEKMKELLNSALFIYLWPSTIRKVGYGTYDDELREWRDENDGSSEVPVFNWLVKRKF